MKKWWKEYFYWNRTERRGVFFLLVLMTLLLGVNLYARWRIPATDNKTDSEFLALATRFTDIDTIEEPEGFAPHNRETYPHREFSAQGYKTRFNLPSAPFNPNGLPQAEWERLGLSRAGARSLKRFEEKGGRFYRKEDLKKLRVIPEAFYTHIEPYLVFPEERKREYAGEKKWSREETVIQTDINRADSARLDALPGISPKTVTRILKVRELFGGFYDLEQLKDLNGFYAPQYEKLRAEAYAGPVNIRPINLNYCTFKELFAVPGLNYETAKAILNHRERVGFFKKTEDLVSLNLAEPGLYAKIAPYLTVK